MAGSGRKAAQTSTSTARNKITKRRQLSLLPLLPPHYRAQRSSSLPQFVVANLAERLEDDIHNVVTLSGCLTGQAIDLIAQILKISKLQESVQEELHQPLDTFKCTQCVLKHGIFSFTCEILDRWFFSEDLHGVQQWGTKGVPRKRGVCCLLLAVLRSIGC